MNTISSLIQTFLWRASWFELFLNWTAARLYFHLQFPKTWVPHLLSWHWIMKYSSRSERHALLSSIQSILWILKSGIKEQKSNKKVDLMERSHRWSNSLVKYNFLQKPKHFCTSCKFGYAVNVVKSFPFFLTKNRKKGSGLVWLVWLNVIDMHFSPKTKRMRSVRSRFMTCRRLLKLNFRANFYA